MIDHIQDNNEGLIELPDCAPSKILPYDLGDAIDGKPIQKYYASSLFSIKQGDLIPENLDNEEFMYKVVGLLKENDVCDKEGIKFLSRVDKQCTTSVQNAGILCNLLHSSKAAVLKLAQLYRK